MIVSNKVRLLQIGLLLLPTIAIAGEPAAITPRNQAGEPLEQSYETNGTIVVLDNGTTIVFLGSYENADPDRTIIITAEESTGLALVQGKNFAYIDSVSRSQQRAAGVTMFQTLTSEESPQEILKLTGKLIVSINMRAEPLMTVSLDTKEGYSFDYSAELASRNSPLNPRSVSFEVDNDNTTPIALMAQGTVTCKAACDDGGGEVTCKGKLGCYAFCDNRGSPKFGCGKKTTTH